MITTRTNTIQVLGKLTARINSLKNVDQLLRTLATNTRASMKHRIHVEGKDSNGNQIGTYSAPYMKVRTGDFLNADTFSKGVNKGKRKNSGTFTDAVIDFDANTGVFSGDEKAGKARPNYNRSDDTTVVISLTRQMENDMVVVATAKGYGIGYNNVENAKKVGYVENTYKKPIFKMTKEEKESNRETARLFIKNA